MHPVASMENPISTQIESDNTILLGDIAREHIKDIRFARIDNQTVSIIEFTDDSPFKARRVCVNPQDLPNRELLEYIHVQLFDIRNKINEARQELNRTSYEVSHQIDRNFISPTNVENMVNVPPASATPENRSTIFIIGDILAWPFLKIYDLFKCLFCCCNSEG